MGLFELLKGVSNELPGCLSTSIVGLEDGLPLASVSNSEDDAAAAADAFHSDLYGNAARALKEMGASKTVGGIVVHGGEATFVSLPLADTGFFWHVVTDVKTTLGFTQAVMRKFEDDVTAGVVELFR